MIWAEFLVLGTAVNMSTFHDLTWTTLGVPSAFWQQSNNWNNSAVSIKN